MPIEYKILPQFDLSVFRWRGVVETSEYRSILESYTSNRNFLPGRTELVDLSQLKDFKADFNQMVSLNFQIQACYANPDSPTRVLIYSPNETMFGMARMMQQLVSSEDFLSVEVYSNLEEVFGCLGLPVTFSAFLEDEILENTKHEHKQLVT